MNYLVVSDEETSLTGNILADTIYEELVKLTHEEGHFVFRIRMEEKDSFEECRFAFSQMEPDVIITFDMAGMRMINETNETIYNYLYCTCFYILTEEPWFYPDTILRRMGILTTVLTLSDYGKEYLERYYENIPFVKKIEVPTAGGRILGFLSGDQEVIVADYWDENHLLEELQKQPEVFWKLATQILALWPNRDKGLFDRIVEVLEGMECPYTEGEVAELTTRLKSAELIFKMRELIQYIGGKLQSDILLLGRDWEKFLKNSIYDSNHSVTVMDAVNETGDISCSQELMRSMIKWIRCSNV